MSLFTSVRKALIMAQLEHRAKQPTVQRPRPILELDVNGDPYGSGFVASESRDGGKSWVYRGDIGARPRSWWRAYARREGFTLRESK